MPGGRTAALWDRPGFRGVIVSGWSCRAAAPGLSGLWTPRDTAVLSIGWSYDPWYRGPGVCSLPRANLRTVTLDGQGHATSPSPEARRAVLEFLEQLR